MTTEADTDSPGILTAQVSGFDSQDLAAGVGALQLVPANSDCLLRLEWAAALAASLPWAGGKPSMSSSRWRSFLNQEPLVDHNILAGEDPFNDLFAASVSFTGGSYRVLPGGANEAIQTVEILLKAIFQHKTPISEPSYSLQAQRLTSATLRLSDEVCRRAGLERGQHSERKVDGSLTVPAEPRFSELKKAVRFTRSELKEVVGPEGVGPLASLTIAAGSLDIDGSSPWTEDRIFATPIISQGDHFVLVLPSGLLTAIRHQLLVLAIENGVQTELEERIGKATEDTAVHLLRRMGFHSHQMEIPGCPDHFEECFLRFDSDKIAHLVVVTDSLEDYDPGHPFGESGPSDHLDRLEERIIDVSKAIPTKSKGVFRESLHIVVVQGAGRSMALGLSERASSDRHLPILLSLADLNILAKSEAGDPLALWKFARAQEVVRKQAKVVGFGVLDEFALYKKADYSFYFSDNERPDTLVITPGSARELIEEVQDQHDIHGTLAYDGRGIVEVERRYPDRSIPIYFPDPIKFRTVAFLVEYEFQDIWVQQSEARKDQLQLLSEICDTVAYWIWQVSPSLERYLKSLADRPNQIAVSVSLEQGDWSLPIDPAKRAAPWIGSTTHPDGRIELSLMRGATAALSGDDNSGERELVREVLNALHRLRSNEDEILDIDLVLDTYVPLGMKKKLMSLDVSANVKLLPGNLQPIRLLQSAELAVCLDMVPEVLALDLGLSVGPVPEDRYTEVLNRIVESHFELLEKRIGLTCPTGLLEVLVANEESLVIEQARLDLTLPTRLECFKNQDGYLDEVKNRRSLHTNSGLACRFLVEYVVALPPNGERPISLQVFDELLALASEIINLGMLSDAIHYQIAKPRISVLPSGRLGIEDQDRYFQSLSSYISVRAEHEVDYARSTFSKHWRIPSDATPLADLEILERAWESEFGFSASDAASFLSAIVEVGMQDPEEPKILSVTEFDRRVAKKLSWENFKIGKVRRFFQLGPRSQFLPESGRSEVYPWRFNREISYLRRPLLLRKNESVDEVIWGIRHVERVGPHLMDLCLSGRLKAESPEMQRYISEARLLESEGFNDQVANLFEQRDELIVRRRVKRVLKHRIERRPGQDLGDIDVFVVRPSSHRMLLVETKDLALARNPAELAQELDKLFVGDQATIAKHLERSRWIRDHTSEVCRWLDLPARSSRWRVETLIVLSRELLSPHLGDSIVPIVTFKNLALPNGSNKFI